MIVSFLYTDERCFADVTLYASLVFLGHPGASALECWEGERIFTLRCPSDPPMWLRPGCVDFGARCQVVS